MKAHRAAALLAALALAAAAVPCRALEVHTVDIAPPGSTVSFASDLDSGGRVVGLFSDGVSQKGFLYSGGSSVEIHPPGWTDSQAIRISDGGLVVGFGHDGGVGKGFLYDSGAYTVLLPPGFSEAQAMAVAPGGGVVGFGTEGVSTRAFIYSGGLYLTVLPPGYTGSRLLDVNGSGHIVGSASDAVSTRAFLFDGTYQFLEPTGWTDTEAIRINDGGEILGSGDSAGVGKCWLYRQGAYEEIFYPGAIVTFCGDLNGRGDVSGVAFLVNGAYVSFVYRQGSYHPLDETIATLFGAAAINDRWQMAGAVNTPGGPAARLASILPDGDLKAKGGDGPVQVAPGELYTIDLSLSAWTYSGRLCDWWLFAQTPSGTWSFDAATRLWAPGLAPAAQLPLRNLKPVSLPPAGSARGAYTYFLGVDFVPNGRLDPASFFFDTLIVFSR